MHQSRCIKAHSIQEGGEMRTIARTVTLVLLAVSFVWAADEVVSAVHGTIEKIDSGTKTVVVKTADGTEHTMHFADQTAVHGAQASADAGADSWHGLKAGTEVVAHYTSRGTEDTAVELDKVGEGGLKAGKGTITGFDRGAKTIVVKGDDGVDATYRLTDHAVKDAGKDIPEGTEKGAKVTVYYTEHAGRKVVHFFEKG
jgi:hypothetical protein